MIVLSGGTVDSFIESIRWVMTGAGTVSLLKVQVLPSQAKDYCERKT